MGMDPDSYMSGVCSCALVGPVVLNFPLHYIYINLFVADFHLKRLGIDTTHDCQAAYNGAQRVLEQDVKHYFYIFVTSCLSQSSNLRKYHLIKTVAFNTQIKPQQILLSGVCPLVHLSGVCPLVHLSGTDMWSAC